MSELEQIFQVIKDNIVIFLATGGYGTLMYFGGITIKQLFTKATTSRIVSAFIDKIGSTLNYVKNKVDLIFNRVQSLQVEVANIENTVNDINAKIEAFMEAILNAQGQEEVLNSFNSILASQPEQTVIQPIVEEVVEEEVVEEPKEKPKKKVKKQPKKKKKEVINYVEELY